MIEITPSKHVRFSVLETFIMLVPLIIVGILVLANAVPELGFFAECQNIPSGDVCSISIK